MYRFHVILRSRIMSRYLTELEEWNYQDIFLGIHAPNARFADPSRSSARGGGTVPASRNTSYEIPQRLIVRATLGKCRNWRSRRYRFPSFHPIPFLCTSLSRRYAFQGCENRTPDATSVPKFLNRNWHLNGLLVVSIQFRTLNEIDRPRFSIRFALHSRSSFRSNNLRVS